MFKKAVAFIFSGFLLLNICGCFLLVAGAVGGAGTAVWLSGKLTQQFNAPYDRTVNATRKALRSFNFESSLKRILSFESAMIFTLIFSLILLAW